MSKYGKAQRLGRDFIFMEDGTLEPLRMNDIMRFLSGSGRTPACPHCDWVGGWEIALNEENSTDTNPKLDIFVIPNLAGDGITTAALTCPQCGYFSQISTYKIRQFLTDQGEGHE